MLKGILLDVDGTLVLSNDAHALAWVAAFEELGYKISFDVVRPLIGMGGDKIIPKLVPGLEHSPEISENISSLRSQIFLDKYAPSLKPAPGSRELVMYIKSRSIKVMVASSAKQEELGVLLKAGKVDDLLQEATTSSDAEESKPAPDIVHAALAKLGLSGPQALMIGDTPYDISAATDAGVPILAVRCGGWKDKDLQGALTIYDDPADLLAKQKTF